MGDLHAASQMQPAAPPVEWHRNDLGVDVLLRVLQVTVECCQVQGLAIEGVADAPANHSLWWTGDARNGRCVKHDLLPAMMKGTAQVQGCMCADATASAPTLRVSGMSASFARPHPHSAVHPPGTCTARLGTRRGQDRAAASADKLRQHCGVSHSRHRGCTSGGRTAARSRGPWRPPRSPGPTPAAGPAPEAAPAAAGSPGIAAPRSLGSRSVLPGRPRRWTGQCADPQPAPGLASQVAAEGWLGSAGPADLGVEWGCRWSVPCLLKLVQVQPGLRAYSWQRFCLRTRATAHSMCARKGGDAGPCSAVKYDTAAGHRLRTRLC